MNSWRNTGVLAALAAALLFGAGTPVAKLLLGATSPWLLAGLLYLGSGVGLALLRRARAAPPVRLAAHERGWLAGAVITGGMLGPALLMWGLSGMPASGAALLLNAEGVFTALLAWFAFRENFDRRIALGMAFIVAGAVVLSWPGSMRLGTVLPALAVLGACLAWAIDNNLTRKIALVDATYIAMVKGLVAGAVNLLLASLAASVLPSAGIVASAMLLGFLSYGLSLVWFVLALRHLGTARTGAYFSTAPFAGAALAVPLLGEALTGSLITAGALMGAGVWLHITERHAHGHQHDRVRHAHDHTHDAHHLHTHEFAWDGTEPHAHEHEHEPVLHTHSHYPDSHHRHEH
jgi:drug/metabolite transporter (DMT)-like permease